MSRTALFAVALFGITLPAHADESFRIQIRNEGKAGDRFHVREVEKTTQKMVVTDAAGKVLNKSDEQPDRTEIYEETIVAKEPGKRPHKLTRKYEKVIVREEDKDVEVPLSGKTVTIERKDGKYAFMLDDGELSTRMLKFLNESFKSDSEDEDKFDDVFLSKRAVRVGETWKCDAKRVLMEILKDTSGNFDVTNATASGKLKETYAKDGRTFGKIAIDVNAPIAAIGKGKDAIAAKSGSFFKIKLDIDACIDGSISSGTLVAKSEMLVNAEISMRNGQKAMLKMTVDSSLTETRRELK